MLKGLEKVHEKSALMLSIAPGASPRHSGREMEKAEMPIPSDFSGPEHVCRLELSMAATVKEILSCSSTNIIHPAQISCLCMFGCGLQSYILSFPLANIYYI